jgi:hypothetical protein
MRKWFIAVATTGLVGVGTVVNSVTGAMTGNTFAATGRVYDQGQYALVRARVTCTENQYIHVRATINQADAWGDGWSRLHRCTGEVQTVPVYVYSAENLFDPGTATVCGLGLNRNQDGHLVDSRQWCRTVTLEQA